MTDAGLGALSGRHGSTLASLELLEASAEPLQLHPFESLRWLASGAGRSLARLRLCNLQDLPRTALEDLAAGCCMLEELAIVDCVGGVDGEWAMGSEWYGKKRGGADWLE